MCSPLNQTITNTVPANTTQPSADLLDNADIPFRESQVSSTSNFVWDVPSDDLVQSVEDEACLSGIGSFLSFNPYDNDDGEIVQEFVGEKTLRKNELRAILCRI